MDIDEIKSRWQSLGSSADGGRTSIFSGDKAHNRRGATALERLVLRYRLMAVMAAMSGVIFPVLLFVTGTDIWLSAAFSVFFLTSAVMDIILQNRVSAIEPTTMTVDDVSRRARSSRHLHHVFQLVLIPLGAALVVWLAMSVAGSHEKVYIWAGMAIGAAVGLGIGLTLYFKTMDNYRSLSRRSGL